MSRTRLAAAALLLPLIAPPLAAQGYPTTPPAPAALRPVRFPPFFNARLANGVSLLVVENHEQPVVTVSLSVPAGSVAEPADKAGLVSLVADVLTKGTQRRTAEQLAAEVEGAGGAIGAGAGNDFLTITISSLSANLGQAFDVLADVVTGATFPESEVELSRTRALSGLQANLSQPGFLAGRAFGREIYGDHPYGRAESPATLRAITREDVVRFYQERIRPGGALLVVAGAVRPAEVRSLASRAFAAWRGAPPALPAAPALPPRRATDILLVHKPGAVQSNIVAGVPFITPRDPALYPLTLMDRVLGGGADSRLFLILREQKGWTYGAYSGFSRPRGTGAFQASAEVRTEVTDSALAEIIVQLNRLRTEALPDGEFQAARNYLIGRFPLGIERPEDIAGAVANARLLGLPDDYVIRYRERLGAVTPAQITAAAARWLPTDRLTIVVVGDGPRVLAGLRAIAPVRIVDAEGRPLTEAELTPRAAAVALDGSRVRAGTWRYRVLVQGNPFGEETRTITRLQDGGRDVWQIITATRLGPILRQDDTTIVDAATLAPIRVRQSGVIQGQNTHVRLDYADGRVRGSSRTPGAQGMVERTVDTTVAAGTLDENAMPAIFLALPWAAGASWDLPLFAASEGGLRPTAIRVEGEDSVMVPAGAFNTWRITVSTSQGPVTMHIAREAPHLALKIELSGAPVAFELLGN